MGVARIFQRRGHTLSNRVYSPFRNQNIVGCLSKKRLTKGGSWAPQDPLAMPLRPIKLIREGTFCKRGPSVTRQTDSSLDKISGRSFVFIIKIIKP